jgi:protein-disulfide isomerase
VPVLAPGVSRDRARRAGDQGTPTIFINGAVHRGDYDAESLIHAITAG